MNGAELASVKNRAEAEFVSSISPGTDKWIYGFHEDSAWNIDFSLDDLWMDGEPGDAAAEARFCAYQHTMTPRVAAGTCSERKQFVCKICPSQEVMTAVPVNKIDLLIYEKRNQWRSKRDMSSTTTTVAPQIADRLIRTSTTTTTGAPRVGERLIRTSTTTTTEEPRGEDQMVVNVKAEHSEPVPEENSSSSESHGTFSVGAIVGMVIGAIVIVAAIILIGYGVAMSAKKNAGTATTKATIGAELEFDDSVI